VLPPRSESEDVVEKDEPVPVTTMVEAVLCEKVPVIAASPPFCIVSVLPAAMFTSAPVARVS